MIISKYIHILFFYIKIDKLLFVLVNCLVLGLTGVFEFFTKVLSFINSSPKNIYNFFILNAYKRTKLEIEMSRTKKFVKNTIFTALLQVVTMISGFLLPKIMLNHYG